MSIKTFLNKNKYVLSAFVLLAMPSLIFDGFENVFTLACRLLLCVGVTLFLYDCLHGKITQETAVFPAFLILSLISCNVIFLTDDVHILLSLLSFFIALFFNKRNIYLTPWFAGLCVVAQPLAILILVPAIVTVQLIKKQHRLALLSVVLSVVFFIITTLFEYSDFYADQYTSYHLSLHLVHFSKSHIEVLLQYLGCNLPLILISLAYIVNLLLNKKRIECIVILISVLLSVIGFAMSENTHTVVMILISVFSTLISLDDKNTAKEKIEKFFINHWFLFLLTVTLTATLPTVLGKLPYESELFSKSTFIIYREE